MYENENGRIVQRTLVAKPRGKPYALEFQILVALRVMTTSAGPYAKTTLNVIFPQGIL